MELSAPLLETITKLAQAGGVGIGMAVVVGAFIVIIRGQPVDPVLAAFRMRTLTLGISFALLALIISSAQFIIGRNPGPVTPGRMTVTFSPSFATEKLPAPAMRLLDGGGAAEVVEDTPFVVSSGATLKISADKLIEQARSLQQVTATAQNLAASNSQLVSALAAVPAVAHALPAPAAPAASAPPASVLIAPAELFKLRDAQVAISTNLKRGNYAEAASTSKTLSKVVIGGQTFAVGPRQP